MADVLRIVTAIVLLLGLYSVPYFYPKAFESLRHETTFAKVGRALREMADAAEALSRAMESFSVAVASQNIEQWTKALNKAQRETK